MTRKPERLTDRPDLSGPSTALVLMTDVLERVRLTGAIFLRAEYTAPWAYESPPPPDLIRVLSPGAERLILFHIVSKGECWIRMHTGERLDLASGDVAVLPYGGQHTMGSGGEPPPVAIGTLLPPPPWERLPVIRYGGGGAETQVVCGYLQCDNLLFEPVLRALPPIFSVRPPAGPASSWMAASIRYALAASSGGQTRSGGLVLRLPELLFAEVLRLHVQSNPRQPSGWLAGLHDPCVGPALFALHSDPARRWTVSDLATESACSRSVLDERFRRQLGMPPMRYLAEWRLRLAADLLRETSLGVATVASRVGYESEEAFNRAFKRMTGQSPGRWRVLSSSACLPTAEVQSAPVARD
jgi:AraC-like DNA-binding protein